MDSIRKWYEYSYRFWMEDDIIPLYEPRSFTRRRIDGLKIYLFEIRTNFQIKKKADDDDDGHEIIMMGSERFGAAVQEDDDEEAVSWLSGQTSFRLNDDYSMPEDQIRTMFRDALNFAKQMPDTTSLSVVPVVVGLDVCTVQQEGEAVNAAVERAIRPECLIPLYVWYWTCMPKGSMQFHEMPYFECESFVEMMPKIRVEEKEAAGLEACPVCSRNFVAGSQISFLPCDHACHSHCVFHWLREGNTSCPSCCAPIPTDFESDDSDLDFDSD